MRKVILQTHCENCGGDAYCGVFTNDAVIIEFLEESPFTCEDCEKETYLEIEKRIY